jgi:hypothetical protein
VGGYYIRSLGFLILQVPTYPLFILPVWKKIQVGSQQSSQNIKRDSSILSTFIFWSIAKFG